MTTDRQEILRRVASGELSPEEADRLLSTEPAATQQAPPPPSPAAGIRTVRIVVGVGGIDVVGDGSIAEAEVDGPHVADIDGDALIIRGDIDRPGDDSDRYETFTFKLGKRSTVKIGGVGAPPATRLRVRMNPALALDTELDAGPLSITDMIGPIRARVAAGPISIERFEGPLDVEVNAGAVRANGILRSGESRVRSDAGAVRLDLDPGSDVHVVAHAALGKVVVPGDDAKRGRFGSDRREFTLGDGTASLRVETSMGSVRISA